MAADTARNPDNRSEDQIVAEMEQHLIAGGILIPAAVLEVVRLQDKGYRLVVNH